MNTQFTVNPGDQNVAEKLNRVAEQTGANPQFVAGLEAKLRNVRRPTTSRWATSFKQISPVLRWAILMVLLALVLSLSIKTLIPAPQPAAEDTPTAPLIVTATPETNASPAPSGKIFDYDHAQIIMNVPFPPVPAQVNVYPAFRSQPVTAEYARVLSVQFGIEGQVYNDADLGWTPERTALMVTDGKQQLMIYAENNYTYVSDLVKYSRANTTFPNENAEAIIREYLQTHGFDFDFQVEAEGSLQGGYILHQLAPDGLLMESDTQGSTRVTLDEDGNILSVQMSLIDYDPASLGNFGILPAEEALTLLTDGTVPIGSTESGGSGPDPNLEPPQHWYREYPDDQTVTVPGNILFYPAVDSNTPGILFMDNVPVTGTINGLETLPSYSFIQATGQFVMENGVRKLNVETWDQNVQETCTSGSAHRDGDRIIITDEGKSPSEYTLIEPPSDLALDTPFPDKQLVSCGVIVDGQFHWTDITLYNDPSQMGGGGGGGGGIFYPLNLSGTPVPFPTATLTQPSAYSSAELASFPSYTVQPGDTCAGIAISYGVSVRSIVEANNLPADCIISVGQTLTIPTTHLDGQRGMVDVQIFQKPDGRQRTAYTFATERGQSYYQLKGDNLEPLQETINRPIRIWGEISVDDQGVAYITVEKFEVLYPDLQFQVLTGKQELKEIDGREVILFITGDITYILMSSDGGYPYPSGNAFRDIEEVKLETLQVPEETYADYPALRVFMMGPAINPMTGKPMELPGTAEKIEVIPDPYGNADQYVAPDTIIEKVELVYYVSDPSFYDPTLEPGQLYLQPVWYFHGHHENGDEVNIFIQALRQEYLLPESQP